MAYNLFLDDNFDPLQIADLPITPVKDKFRYRTYNWIIVKTFDEFVDVIKTKGIPSIVSFDHDLSPEHWDFIYNDENWLKLDEAIIVDYDLFEVKTGYHAAEWLLEYCHANKIAMPLCLVHSQNAVGRKNIENLLF
jgi:hypothetical protein